MIQVFDPLNVPEAKRPNFTAPFMGRCCTKKLRDSLRESNVVAGLHEQTVEADLQDHQLALECPHRVVQFEC